MQQLQKFFKLLLKTRYKILVNKRYFLKNDLTQQYSPTFKCIHKTYCLNKKQILIKIFLSMYNIEVVLANDIYVTI